MDYIGHSNNNSLNFNVQVEDIYQIKTLSYTESLLKPLVFVCDGTDTAVSTYKCHYNLFLKG